MTSFQVDDPEEFKNKALIWADTFPTFCFLDSNNYKSDNYHSYECLLAIDSQMSLIASKNSFEQLKAFRKDNPEWLFGYFSYDLKNQIENLSSNNEDHLLFPELYFFIPRYLLQLEGNKVLIDRPYLEAVHIYENINQQAIPNLSAKDLNFKARISKEDYISTVEKIRQHIIEGDIYEMNFCQEFYADHVMFNPGKMFVELNKQTKAPFSACLKNNFHYALSFSPERFLKKMDDRIISQPVKGTIKKGESSEENEKLKEQLRNDRKERAENVMIVDLVRNDLNKSGKTGSTHVEELFGIYSFEKVNHMISTISSEKRDDIHFLDVIRNAFPMGSMTGAPKIMAMELIERYERTKRGLFSGAIGYIDPDDNFDFNVVIRTLLYNSENKYASIMVGSAITYLSDPGKEYEECLLKAESMLVPGFSISNM